MYVMFLLKISFGVCFCLIIIMAYKSFKKVCKQIIKNMTFIHFFSNLKKNSISDSIITFYGKIVLMIKTDNRTDNVIQQLKSST